MSLHGHVLLVDDLDANRDALGRMLQKEGLTVEEARDGFEALEKVKRGAFDVILLDVMMPGMDGIQVLTRLKEDPEQMAVPVVMLSALHEAQAVRQCIEIGADDFLPKPIDRLLLRARLASSLRRKQLQDREQEYLTRLEASNGELRRLSQLKSRFLAIAAHDLKNPMTTVMLLADQMMEIGEEDFSPAMVKKSSMRIRDSVQKMLGIIQALLDSAALEAGQFILRKRPTDLNALVQSVAEDNRVYGASKSILLRCLTPDHGDWVSMVDEIRIREAFDNLVNNAIKFSPPNSEIQVVLEPRIEGTQRVAVMMVTDNGPGLSEEDKANVFGVYQRLSAKPTGGEVSTGLGLSIVKQMIELHGGKVWVDSECGRGACFCIQLPLTAVEVG